MADSKVVRTAAWKGERMAELKECMSENMSVEGTVANLAA